MKRTIRWQLIFSFLLLSSLIIGLTGWGTSRLMDVYFQDYVGERKETEIFEYITELEEAYDEKEGFDEQELQNLRMIAMHSDFSFSLYNEEGQLLESSSSGMGMQENQHMHGMKNQPAENSIEKTYSLKKGKTTIGTVSFRFQESSLYSEDDERFIKKMKQNFLIVGGTAFLFSIFFASWVAQKFSRPLIRINQFTKEVSRGDYQKSLSSNTSIVEMNELMNTLNELTSQLKRQEEMRNQLSRDLAHEIRTPLTTLKGNIEAMMDGIWAPTTKRLETCHIEINRMTRLIGNIERLNEMENQSLVLQKSEFDLKDLSNQIAANFEALIKEKNLSIHLNGESVVINADRDKISQMITNLLNNAIKFTPNGGSIYISIEKEAPCARYIIKDTGVGMNENELKYIFDRFYRTDPSRNSRLGGQGIGLSIVKSIVEAHQGKVTLNSRYGEGTTFVVEFPVE